jgi:hypothetical protein
VIKILSGNEGVHMQVNGKEVQQEWIEKFSNLLVEHLTHFQSAAQLLDVPKGQIVTHDKSKWQDEEWLPCVRRFGGGIKDVDEFNLAWLHHIHHNKHHPEHWAVIKTAYKYGGQDNNILFLPMPYEYVQEMIADWMAVQKTYADSWDMCDWLTKNWFLLPIHKDTRMDASGILYTIGYCMDKYTGQWTRKQIIDPK